MPISSAPTETLVDAVFRFKSICTAHGTGKPAENAEFVRLRQVLLSDPVLNGRLPPFVRRCRSLEEFWTFIKGQDDPSGAVGRYEGRSKFLREAFDPILDELEAAQAQASSGVDLDVGARVQDPASRSSITAQLRKCDERIGSGDFAGAITNGRTMVEAILIELDARLGGEQAKNDGDLGKLYKRVQRKLNLDPAGRELSQQFLQVLGGLTSIINGLAGLRNELSDAHATRYRADRHHAVLVVNAAKTISQFLLDSYEYQRAKGRLG